MNSPEPFAWVLQACRAGSGRLGEWLAREPAEKDVDL